MTAASHRGPELDRSRKKKLIPMYRAAAKKYRPLIGRHSLITCEDGLVIDILWEKRNFEHLCGVWCDRPPQVVHAGKTIEANYFFDQLIKGRLPSSAIHYSDYPRTRGKAEVLSNALDLEGNVDVVVDSDKAEVVYYLGGEAWCLGLDSDWNGNRMRSGLCNGNVFYPKSIRRQSVYKRMRTDSIPHRVFSGGTGQPLSPCRRTPEALAAIAYAEPEASGTNGPSDIRRRGRPRPTTDPH